MTDREQSACELGSIGALSMLESRLESIRVERDGALAEVERLRRLVREVLQTRNRSGGPWQEMEDADHSYRSVPLETAFTVRVKYRFDGELAPLPYPLDE